MTAFISDTLRKARERSRAEQTELIAQLQQLVMPAGSELVFPGVYKTPGISGGDACLGATRVPVFRVVKFLNEAVTENDIIGVFPSLNLYDIEVAKRYYSAFTSEIDAAINEEE